MVAIHLDGFLREFVRVRQVESTAPTVRGALEELERRYPRLGGKLRDEGGTIRRFVRVYLNGEDVHGLGGLDTPVRTEDRIDILHSIAGG